MMGLRASFKYETGIGRGYIGMKIFFALLTLFFTLPGLGYTETLFQLQPYSREVTFTGFSRPVRAMTVSAEVNGQCVDVAVDVGDLVAEQNPAILLDTILARLDLDKNRIAQEQAKRQLTEEKNTLSRYRELIDKKSTAQATYDEAKLRADLYTFTFKGLQVEEKSLLEILRRHEIHVPAGWLVTRRLVEPGEYVRAGEPLLELGDFRRITVTFLLTDQEVAVLERLESTLLQLPDYKLSVAAGLHRVSPLFDPVSKKTAVELIFDADPRLPQRAGLRCLLVLPTGEVSQQFVVPATALVSRYEAHWLVAPAGERHKVIVLGYLENGASAVITGNNLAIGQDFQTSPSGNGAP